MKKLITSNNLTFTKKKCNCGLTSNTTNKVNKPKVKKSKVKKNNSKKYIK